MTYPQFISDANQELLREGRFVPCSDCSITPAVASAVLFESPTCLLKFYRHQADNYCQIAARPSPNQRPKWLELGEVAAYYQRRLVNMELTSWLSSAIERRHATPDEVVHMSVRQMQPCIAQIIAFFNPTGFEQRHAAYLVSKQRNGAESRRQMDALRKWRAATPESAREALAQSMSALSFHQLFEILSRPTVLAQAIFESFDDMLAAEKLVLLGNYDYPPQDYSEVTFDNATELVRFTRHGQKMGIWRSRNSAPNKVHWVLEDSI